MIKTVSAALIAFASLFVSSAAIASPSQQYSQAIVEKAAAFAAENGKEKLIAEVNRKDGPFNQGELYVFVYDKTGTLIADPVNQIIINHEVAAALRELRLLDADCERLVFRIRAHHDGAVLPATDDDLEELIGFLAAE